jgi:ATP-dependent Clp protease ATP-binding subunit ClpX
MSENALSCSFCSKASKDVKKLIAGPPNVYICDECVNVCYQILIETPSTTKSIKETKKIPSAIEIKKFLDDYVIGQDYAKEIVSVAVNNHYKRLENPVINGIEIEKSNLLMCGASGVGKTFICQTVAKLLEVPFVIVDATTLTESGYVGDDAETIITRLLSACDNDVRQAERGIIFLDEIDKKKSSPIGANGRDVSGEGVQQALLKIIEGTDVLVPPAGSKKSAGELLKVNTKNILFVVSGAFVGLEKIVEKSLPTAKTKIGFNAEVGKKTKSDELLKQIESEHLVQYGLIPELVGRLPIIAPLNELTEEQLVEILVKPKNAILKQFQALFSLEKIELEFTDSALTAIAQKAIKKKTNGRGLRNVLENTLMKIQFNLSKLKENGITKIVITDETVLHNAEPLYINNTMETL